MPNAIETAAYNIPDSTWERLNNFYTRNLLIAEHSQYSNYQNLPKSAEELGMQPCMYLPTKKAFWTVYEGNNLGIPNFPAGETEINQALALYEEQDPSTKMWACENVILRLSQEPIPPDEFAKDLEAFTKYYIDRPKFWGFPSKAMTNGTGHIVALFSGIGGGGIGGGLGAYLTNAPLPEPGLVYVTGGTLIGGIASLAASIGMHFFSEVRARNKISNLDQYMSGQEAVGTIEEQYNHKIKVGIQRELYSALQQEGFKFTHEEFLTDVYRKISAPLMLPLIAQDTWDASEVLEEVKHPDSLSKMVSIAHILYDKH